MCLFQFIFYCSNISTAIFNKFEGKTQASIMSLVSKMKHNQANPNIQYLADLLAYFASIPSALYKNSYVTIKNENNQESFVLEKDVIENCLNDDYELLKYIQKFSEIEIKLQYPIDDFDTIYEYVKCLKSLCFTLKLRIFH